MELVKLKLTDIHPYKRNARKNDQAVEAVAESIKQCGYRSPIVVDENNVILCGHTRYKALKKLGWTECNVVRDEYASDEQKKKYRLLDNKVGEIAEWDNELLKIELDGMDFEGFDFGFDIGNMFEVGGEESEDADKENERMRTNNAYNLQHFDVSRSEGKYDMPTLAPVDYVPNDLIGFNYARSTNEYDKCIHFFIDDYQFERVWNDPHYNIDVLVWFDAVLTPDFSLYMDMPKAMQIWNIYRSRLFGQMCQDSKMTVIPTVSWSDEKSFDFCFDGLPKRGTLAVSTVGVLRHSESRAIWDAGMKECIKRCDPIRIILYGEDIDFDFGDIEIVRFKNQVTERMSNSVSN